jgi:hypothetical protein
MDGAAAAYMGSNLLLQLLHAAIHGGDVLAAVPKGLSHGGATPASTSIAGLRITECKWAKPRKTTS